MPEGIEVRHRKGCPATRNGRCRCHPTYRAGVWSQAERRKIYASFPTADAAKSWRIDALQARRSGTLRTPDPTTVREAARRWIELAQSGQVRDRSGRPYKPSTLRSYRGKLDGYVLPELGDLRLDEVRRRDVQDLVDRLLADGRKSSTVRNTLDPLRALYRWAIRRELVATNPTSDLDIPMERKGSIDIVTAPVARTLIDALPTFERATWATAFYAGLRRGELQAMRVRSIDLGASEIRVERSWDQEQGVIEPKSDTSVRTVPLLAVLRDYLDEHLLSTGRTGDDLAFGRTASDPFVPTTLAARTRKAWDVVDDHEREAAEREGRRPVLLPRPTLHPARHTFASTLIAAGENPKAVQEFMGHSSITVTFDEYGHLFPGNREQARTRMDAYLSAELEGTTAGQ